MKRLLILTLLILTACGPNSQPAEPASQNTFDHTPTVPAQPPTSIPAARADTATPAPEIFPTPDSLSALPAPACNGSTPADQEGPYYTPNTPERASLLEDRLTGDTLIVTGYVLDANCQPVANAWLDFWQADANGEYDNSAYRLRGHQFTDAQGRYQLETIMPGIYPSRPIRHIHVKVQAPNGEILTTQLYFPEQPIEGLTVELSEADGQYLAIYNFVLP